MTVEVDGAKGEASCYSAAVQAGMTDKQYSLWDLFLIKGGYPLLLLRPY